MGRADDPAHLVQGRRGVEDPLPDQRVLPDEGQLVLVERLGLREDAVGDRELADVVELRCQAELLERRIGDSERGRRAAGSASATPPTCTRRFGSRSSSACKSTACGRPRVISTWYFWA